MPYRFRKKGKPLDEAVRAIAGFQVDRALARLEDSEDAAAAALDVQARCEKVISLLELVSAHFAGAAAEIDSFEEIDRHVSTAAAVASAQRGLKALAPYLARRVPNLDLAALDAALTNDAAHLEAQNALASTLLHEARERIAGWRVEAADWQELAAGLATAHDALGDQSPHELPELRATQLRSRYRRAAQLWHQSRLLKSVAPQFSRPIRKPLKLVCQDAAKVLDVKHLKELMQPLAYGFGEASPYEFILVLSRREEILRCAHLHRATNRLRGSASERTWATSDPTAQREALLLQRG